MLHSPLVFLHILTMFAVVAFHSGPQILTLAAARTGQETAVGPIARMYGRTGRAVPPLGILGALLGIGAGLTGGFNLLAPWLLIAYVLFAGAMITGIGFNSKFGPRLLAATADAPDGPLTPEIVALFTDPRYRLVTTVDLFIVIAFLFDMVVKPFS